MSKPILLMTRARAASQAFVARLDGIDAAQVIYAPLIEIAPVGIAPDLQGYAGVIFTSRNGAELAPPANGTPAYCVGERTAERARALGWPTPIVALDANDLVAQLTTALVPGPLMHLAGTHRRGDIDTRLTEAGIHTDVAVLYDQPLLPLSDDAKGLLSPSAGEVPVVLPLFSPRTAAHLATQGRIGSHVHLLAISPAVADAIGTGRAANVFISEAPTGEEMKRSVENLLRSNRLS